MSGVALLALADACERATGPDRETDVLIQCAIEGITPQWVGMDGHLLVAGHYGALGSIDPGKHQRNFSTSRATTGPGSIPAYTASLDAAMSLVPDGVERLPLSFKAERFYLGSGIWKSRASVWDGLGGVSSLDTASEAATPALALIAAALRARAHHPSPDTGGVHHG